mgnify:CR=1 FL=1
MPDRRALPPSQDRGQGSSIGLTPGSEERLHTSIFGDTTVDQIVLAATLLATVASFMLGRYRYDMVAISALIFLAVVEIVPREDAFTGFGHPAIVTVAAILVISRGLDNSGVVDVIARRLALFGARPSLLVGSQGVVVAAASSLMNNVGALALLMPVAMRVSRRNGHRAAVVLMPLAFSSLLGGMVTLIGTPPNIIVASSREGGFGMFDFAPVGLAVAVVGIAYLSLVGWRLIPIRDEGSDDVAFQLERYLTEVEVSGDSKAAGLRIREIEATAGASLRIVAILRRGRRMPAPSAGELVEGGDILIVEAEAEELSEFVADAGVAIVSAREAKEEAREAAEAEAEAVAVGTGPDDEGGEEGEAATLRSPASPSVQPPASDAEDHDEQRLLRSDEIALVEAVVRPGGMIAGHSAAGLRLRERFRVNLLAVARQGGTVHLRLDQVRVRPGDVLLIQAPSEGLPTTLSTLGLLPLAERGLSFSTEPRILIAIAIAGLALVSTVVDLLPIEVAATLAALAMGATGLVSLRESYEAIDWPVLLLLGAMLPLGGAIETTGTAALVADLLVTVSDGLPLLVVTALVIVLAMMLSDVVNNVATVVLLIPISLSLADGLGVPSDVFLMAVAVGASSAFLTPIGHQSNVLVMGPGGYRFSDYWRVGLLLEVLIVIVATPMIVLVWG